MPDRLRRGYELLVHWLERNWGAREWFLSTVFAMLFVIWAAVTMLGVVQAYHVDSAAEIVSAEAWGDLTDGANEIDSVLLASVYLLFSTLSALWIDIIGRITYEYLLWVPEGLWDPLMKGVLVIPTILMTANVMHLLQSLGLFTSTEGTGGETHG